MAQTDPKKLDRLKRAFADGAFNAKEGRALNAEGYSFDPEEQQSFALGYENRKKTMAEPTKYEGLPVAGYKPQSQDKVDLVNGFKLDEERILRKIDVLRMNTVGTYDQRMLAKAFTEIQDGFMWLNRAVFQPGRLDLPEDDLKLASDQGYFTAEHTDGPKYDDAAKHNPYPDGTAVHDAWRDAFLKSR